MASDMGGGRTLPKFGEWDVNNPATSEEFTVIFQKARDEKRSGASDAKPKNNKSNHNPSSNFKVHKKWFQCCAGSKY